MFMKNMIKYLAAAGLALTMAACNKAEFKDPSFVSLANARFSISEDGGILEVPVILYGADECIVTYTVSEGTAKEGTKENGKNYEVIDRNGNLNKTGVISVSNVDKDANDVIRIRIHDYTGTETGSLKFHVNLTGTDNDKIGLGAFNKCECTIIDKDSGLVKLIGSYVGEGTSLATGGAVEFTFDLEEYDPSADEEAEYPEANCMLTNGNFNNGDMTFAVPVYGYFDINMSQIRIYALQPFNAYTFTDLGNQYVCFGNYPKTAAEDDIILNVVDGKLELQGAIVIYVCDPESFEIKGMYDGLEEGYIWTKE